MPEIKQSRSAEETIARRMQNSGGVEADKTIKSGEGVRRTFHNVHLSGRPSPAWRTKQRRARQFMVVCAPS